MESSNASPVDNSNLDTAMQELVVTKYEDCNSEVLATQGEDDQTSGQIYGYLEVQDPGSENAAIFLNSEEFNLNGHQLILTQNDEGNDVFVVVREDPTGQSLEQNFTHTYVLHADDISFRDEMKEVVDESSQGFELVKTEEVPQEQAGHVYIENTHEMIIIKNESEEVSQEQARHVYIENTPEMIGIKNESEEVSQEQERHGYIENTVEMIRIARESEELPEEQEQEMLQEQEQEEVLQEQEQEEVLQEQEQEEVLQEQKQEEVLQEQEPQEEVPQEQEPQEEVPQEQEPQEQEPQEQEPQEEVPQEQEQEEVPQEQEQEEVLQEQVYIENTGEMISIERESVEVPQEPERRMYIQTDGVIEIERESMEVPQDQERHMYIENSDRMIDNKSENQSSVNSCAESPLLSVSNDSTVESSSPDEAKHQNLMHLASVAQILPTGDQNSVESDIDTTAKDGDPPLNEIETSVIVTQDPLKKDPNLIRLASTHSESTRTLDNAVSVIHITSELQNNFENQTKLGISYEISSLENCGTLKNEDELPADELSSSASRDSLQIPPDPKPMEDSSSKDLEDDRMSIPDEVEQSSISNPLLNSELGFLSRDNSPEAFEEQSPKLKNTLVIENNSLDDDDDDSHAGSCLLVVEEDESKDSGNTSDDRSETINDAEMPTKTQSKRIKVPTESDSESISKISTIDNSKLNVSVKNESSPLSTKYSVFSYKSKVKTLFSTDSSRSTSALHPINGAGEISEALSQYDFSESEEVHFKDADCSREKNHKSNLLNSQPDTLAENLNSDLVIIKNVGDLEMNPGINETHSLQSSSSENLKLKETAAESVSVSTDSQHAPSTKKLSENEISENLTAAQDSQKFSSKDCLSENIADSLNPTCSTSKEGEDSEETFVKPPKKTYIKKKKHTPSNMYYGPKNGIELFSLDHTNFSECDKEIEEAKKSVNKDQCEHVPNVAAKDLEKEPSHLDCSEPGPSQENSIETTSSPENGATADDFFSMHNVKVSATYNIRKKHKPELKFPPSKQEIVSRKTRSKRPLENGILDPNSETHKNSFDSSSSENIPWGDVLLRTSFQSSSANDTPGTSQTATGDVPSTSHATLRDVHSTSQVSSNGEPSTSAVNIPLTDILLRTSFQSSFTNDTPSTSQATADDFPCTSCAALRDAPSTSQVAFNGESCTSLVHITSAPISEQQRRRTNKLTRDFDRLLHSPKSKAVSYKKVSSNKKLISDIKKKSKKDKSKLNSPSSKSDATSGGSSNREYPESVSELRIKRPRYQGSVKKAAIQYLKQDAVSSSAAPSKKSNDNDFHCSSCNFSSGLVNNLIEHLKYCINRQPLIDYTVEDMNKRQRIRGEDIDTAEKLRDFITGSFNEMRNLNDLNEGECSGLRQNVDSDDEMDMDVNDKKSKYGYGEDDVVWAKVEDRFWPGLVCKLEERKASIKLINYPNEMRGLKISAERVHSFDDAKWNKMLLAEAENLPNNEIFVRAVQTSETFVRKKWLGLNVKGKDFFSIPDKVDFVTDSESSDSNINEDSDFDIADLDTFTIPLHRKARYDKLDIEKVKDYIVGGHADKYVLDIHHNRESSVKHQKFMRRSRNNSLEHRTWFGPCESICEQGILVDHFRSLFLNKIGHKNNFLSYIFQVWIPEAIVKAISVVEGIPLKEAEDLFESEDSTDHGDPSIEEIEKMYS